LGAPCLGPEEPSMTPLYKKFSQRLQENLPTPSDFHALLLR
jgi:hypothetical protein